MNVPWHPCCITALQPSSQCLDTGAFRRSALTLLAGIALALLVLTVASAAAAGRAIHVFPQSGEEGCYPQGPLLRAATGALYGTTSVCGAYHAGTVFELKPPTPGQTQWTFAVLYEFRGGDDGNGPAAGLVMDAQGALYGTTMWGGRYLSGVVFQLAPPAPGQSRWTHTVLHEFRYNYATGDADGAEPLAGLLMDRSGALYGTTPLGGTAYPQPCCGFGTVFKLTPPRTGQSKWEETVIYRFAGGADGQSPMAALTTDSSGALYGTTRYGGRGSCTDGWGYVAGCGTVFQLTPPRPDQTAWTKQTLYRFKGRRDGAAPQGQLLHRTSGALYGTTISGGNAPCRVDSSTGCGTVWKLTPPTAGKIGWKKSILHSFQGPEGAFP